MNLGPVTCSPSFLFKTAPARAGGVKVAGRLGYNGNPQTHRPPAVIGVTSIPTRTTDAERARLSIITITDQSQTQSTVAAPLLCDLLCSNLDASHLATFEVTLESGP